MKDFENMERRMPYKMPEHFMDDMTEKVVARIAAERQTVSIKRQTPRYYLWAAVAGVAAMAVLLLHPVNFSNSVIPDYENISQCEDIDDVFQTMSADDLGLYSMMSSYYEE